MLSNTNTQGFQPGDEVRRINRGHLGMEPGDTDIVESVYKEDTYTYLKGDVTLKNFKQDGYSHSPADLELVARPTPLKADVKVLDTVTIRGVLRRHDTLEVVDLNASDTELLEHEKSRPFGFGWADIGDHRVHGFVTKAGFFHYLTPGGRDGVTSYDLVENFIPDAT
jgi:hypothetical protein